MRTLGGGTEVPKTVKRNESVYLIVDRKTGRAWEMEGMIDVSVVWEASTLFTLY